MTEDIREKKKSIIQASDKAIEQLENIKEKTAEGKSALTDIENRVTEDIFNLKKSRDIWVTIPDDKLLHPSPELGSLGMSGCNLTASMYNQSLLLKKKVQEYVEGIGSLHFSISANATTSSTIRAVSLDAGKILVPDLPQIEPVLKEAEAPNPIQRRKQIHAKLKEIEPRLGEKFDGAWKTIEDNTKPDRFRQAAHSMREVLSDFEHILAPDDLIIETGWFKKSGQKEITQRIRVKFAIIGKGDDEGIDENAIDAINNVMDDARKRYKDLNEIAHARGESETLFPLLESYFLSCEAIIKGILELREEFFKL